MPLKLWASATNHGVRHQRPNLSSRILNRQLFSAPTRRQCWNLGHRLRIPALWSLVAYLRQFQVTPLSRKPHRSLRVSPHIPPLLHYEFTRPHHRSSYPERVACAEPTISTLAFSSIVNAAVTTCYCDRRATSNSAVWLTRAQLALSATMTSDSAPAAAEHNGAVTESPISTESAEAQQRTRLERSFPSYMTTASQMSLPPPGSVLTGKQEHC